MLKRFTSKVVLSFDPDAAGKARRRGRRNCWWLKGFRSTWRCCPRAATRTRSSSAAGGRAYVERLTASRPYLEFLLDRAAAKLDLNRPEQPAGVSERDADRGGDDSGRGRRAISSRIGWRTRRGSPKAVVRDEIRKAAAQRKTEAPAVAVRSTVRLLPAEQGLLWALVHQPVEGLAAVGAAGRGGPRRAGVGADPATGGEPGGRAAGLAAGAAARASNEGERALLERAAPAGQPPAAPPADCVNALKRAAVRAGTARRCRKRSTG